MAASLSPNLSQVRQDAEGLGIRPLKARSVVLSALLGFHPPQLPVSTLVRIGELFGIAEGTIRVGLTRMVADGDVVADNGRGYSNPTRSKSVDFEGRVGIQPIPGLNIAGGFLSGKRGLETYSAPAIHTATRWDGLVAYNGDFFHVGGEYFQAKNFNNVTTVATDKADGYSIWASIIPTPAFTIFGRYDKANPSKTLKPALKDMFFDAGLQWRANKSFAASVVYKYEEVKNGSISTSDGTIGSTKSNNKGNYNEFGIWTVYSF